MKTATRLRSGDPDHSRSDTSRPEHELVLACSRTSFDEAEAARVKDLLNGRLDWDYFFRFARRHSLLPLVYFQLNNRSPASVPPEQLARLRKHYQENAARNLILMDELCRLLTALLEANIEAVPYKGPALALAAYGDLSLRRFIDLDLMVRKSDALKAEAILMKQGYVHTRAWTNAQQEVLLRTQHNLQMQREEGRLILELHWEAAAELFASRLQAEELWSRLDTVKLNGITFRSFSHEDQLLLLCVHGSRHLWDRLAWICDVAELLKRERPIDWSGLLRRADANGNERKLLLGLKLASELFNAKLPAEVSTRIAEDSTLLTLRNQVKQRLFSGSEQLPASLREIFKFNFYLRERWQQRLHYCRHILRPTDGDVARRSLPSVLSFGYYLTRPWRLLREDRGPSVPVSARRHA